MPQNTLNYVQKRRTALMVVANVDMTRVLEIPTGAQLDGTVDRTILQQAMVASQGALWERLENYNWDEREQILTALGSVLVRTPREISKLTWTNPSFRVVEVNRDELTTQKWRTFPAHIYLISNSSSECSIRLPLAGIAVSLATGRHVLKCMKHLGLAGSNNAKWGCKYYEDEPVLMVHRAFNHWDARAMVEMLRKVKRGL